MLSSLGTRVCLLLCVLCVLGGRVGQLDPPTKLTPRSRFRAQVNV